MLKQSDVYAQLAKKLDQMPQGYPPAADGSDIAALRWIFTPEEAELAVALPPKPASAETLAQLLGRPAAELSAILDRMCQNSQIVRLKKGGEFRYIAMPWIPGIQEGQFWRKDKTPEEIREFAHLWESYFPSYAKVAAYGPHIGRIVPVNAGITSPSQSQTHRLEDVHRMVNEAKSFYVSPCVCREEKRTLGKGCDHLSEVCMVVSATENDDFDSLAVAREGTGRVIDKDEAHRILDAAAADGLVHQTSNIDGPSTFFICNCCSCCCMFLRLVNEFGQHFSTTSNFAATIDMDVCVQCGDCLDDRCAVHAIAEDDGEYAVDQARCIGCGICTVSCPVEAIELERKPEQSAVPTAVEWGKQRASSRPETL